MSKKTLGLQVLGVLMLWTAAGCVSSDQAAPSGATSFTAAAVRQRWAKDSRETAGQSPSSLTVDQAIREALAASPA